MTLRATFGWHLDGPYYPEEPAIGESVLGPLGLVHQLALQLGLISSFPAQAIRIAEYLARMRALDNAHRFYSRSFQVDPWGTARALLRLRDELVSSGWSARTTYGAGVSRQISARIRTLAELELVSDTGIECLSDKCGAVATRLENSSTTPLASIRVVDRFDSLPPIWRRILRALKTRGTQVILAEGKTHSQRNPNSDIDRLAMALLGRASSCEFSGDQTLTFIEADDEVQCADLTADWLQSERSAESWEESCRRMAIIRGNSTSFLDQLLRKRGLPCLGNGTSSSLRGFTQLLPLALDMCWQPTSPQRLIELLTLPFSPIPKFAASAFSDALKMQPGIGGSAWLKAWDIALSRKRTVLERGEDADPEKIEQELEGTRQSWSHWLAPDTVSQSEAIGSLHLKAVCHRVRSHALSLHAVHEHDVFAQTAAWSETLAESVESSKADSVTQAQLDRMLDSVTGGGYVADQPQASPWTPVDHPGQIFGAADSVIWWGFIDATRHISSNPWTEAELIHLAEDGVELDPPTAGIAREANSWRRPILYSKKLTILKPRTVAGKPVAAHPFYHEIVEHVEKAPAPIRAKLLHQTHLIYRQPSVTTFSVALPREEIERTTLPQPRYAWEIAANTMARPEESPSSLERMLGCPLSWLLQFVARLKPSTVSSMSDSEQMSGLLAHAVIAYLLPTIARPEAESDSGNTAAPLSQADIGVLAETTFDDLCPKIAAPLLMPGKSLERTRLRKAVRDAAINLSSILAQAQFDSIECETEHSATIDGLNLKGRTDVLINGYLGYDIVLDLKLSRTTLYYRKRLSEGTAIQLAAYSWMIDQERQRHSVAAYYMLAQKQLLCSAKQPFPEHTYVQGPSLSETFQNLVANYRTHLKHINSGTVYATGIPAPSDSHAPASSGIDLGVDLSVSPIEGITLALEPPCTICNYGNLCGKKGAQT